MQKACLFTVPSPVFVCKEPGEPVTHISRTVLSCSSLDFFSSISQSSCWPSSASNCLVMSSTSCHHTTTTTTTTTWWTIKRAALRGNGPSRQTVAKGPWGLPAVVLASSASVSQSCYRRTFQKGQKTCTDTK